MGLINKGEKMPERHSLIWRACASPGMRSSCRQGAQRRPRQLPLRGCPARAAPSGLRCRENIKLFANWLLRLLE